MRAVSFLCLGALVLLSGCSWFQSAPPAPQPQQTEDNSTRKRLPVRPLNVATTSCKFQDETGYRGQTSLEVRDGKVLRMRTTINVPKKGQCTFDMAGMKQIKAMPSIEMKNAKNKCVVRIWEQGDKVTMSMTDCSARCSPRKAFDYVWPVMINTTSGECTWHSGSWI